MPHAQAIYRGIPGLGRVVAGFEILEILERDHGFTTQVFTYGQGQGYAKLIGRSALDGATNSDISQIGIIPVSRYGEKIISTIEANNPDIVIMDGEPLLQLAIRAHLPKIKILSILNPLDIDNPSNPESSRTFFHHCYQTADFVLFHGSLSPTHMYRFKKDYYVPQLIRQEIEQLAPNRHSQQITCILGGGSELPGSELLNGTKKMANVIINIAKLWPQYKFVIFTGGGLISEGVPSLLPTNVIVRDELSSPRDLFSECRYVIARAGRNTLSELTYLDIPAIVFSTACPYRNFEQTNNAIHSKSSSAAPLIAFDHVPAVNELSDAIRQLDQSQYSPIAVKHFPSFLLRKVVFEVVSDLKNN